MSCGESVGSDGSTVLVALPPARLLAFRMEILCEEVRYDRAHSIDFTAPGPFANRYKKESINNRRKDCMSGNRKPSFDTTF